MNKMVVTRHWTFGTPFHANESGSMTSQPNTGFTLHTTRPIAFALGRWRTLDVLHLIPPAFYSRLARTSNETAYHEVMLTQRATLATRFWPVVLSKSASAAAEDW